ncbi:hypothetical protein fugu_011729 [Takifugu bimaculatus]|uniref:Annexin n=1 Tax=Takifugu bimaculatus TaxID=433685 RepID=A0A4Z2C8C6_9TELE|nr:hypothetical protein fugu_011729 [Takifugu bimaculatus]
MHFTEYLREVAQVCSEDYNIISPGALQYSEDVLKSCLECIKTIPQLYQIHEMTSLTGGTFNPALTLTFEKQLLIMGNVDITDHKMVPADAQLASDYQSVSSVTPPAKKAKDMHATISSDSNAETLSARYEPHVCLTRDALFRLLNNHGPDFGEHWEVPVWVKLNPGKGRGQKTVYIDSPLLKTEITMREMNHIYHEESLKHSIKKNGQKHVFHLMSELPANEKPFTSESSKRNVVSFENDSLDFEVDLTDLETFGESTPAKKPKKELHNSTKITTHPAVSETVGTKPKQINSKSDQETEHTSSIDSDEEKLVIDDSVSQTLTPKKQPLPSAAPFSAGIPLTSESTSDKPELSSSPQKLAKHGRHSRRPRDCGDQLSEILRMQSAMFNPTNNSAKSSATSQETKSPSQSQEPSVHPPAVSLVKPCVTSYLERNESVNSHESAPLVNILTEHKRLLSEDLQAGAEDEQDYDAPEEGNLIYKLYSLHDLLLMVRTSVALSHTRSVGSSENKHVPVHVLPKLEYQLCYGVECLSSSEACELWTEALLHSSTVSYTAHINAHTSKVALLRKLPDGWIHSISCGFKPSKSLNILHHLLKKLSGLAEGRYLIVHKAGEPFVALMKEAGGKVARGSYNLQQVHSSVPRPPASGAIPWIPVDPAVVLPVPPEARPDPLQLPSDKRPEAPLVATRGTGWSPDFSRKGEESSHEPTFPTVVPAVDFDPNRDAARIETAIKTKGVDEQTIIDVLTKRTYSQRREIAFSYERKAKKDMITALKGALSGSLESVILGLMKSTTQYDASEIRGSIKGLGTDEETLIEILCSRSNTELLEIKQVYKELFKKELDKDVAGDTSGNFAKLLLALVQAKRAEPSAVVDSEKIDQDARALYQAGIGVKGTDVPTWISIMSERSVPHLQKVFQRYKSYSPYDMQESIIKEVKGDLQKSFLVIVQCVENKQLYFAKRLNEAMKGKGAKEKLLTRIIVSRCEVDLKKVCSEYKAHFGESLQKAIQEHTKGDYQKVILSLCGPEE